MTRDELIAMIMAQLPSGEEVTPAALKALLDPPRGPGRPPVYPAEVGLQVAEPIDDGLSKRAATIVIDGRSYLWRVLCERRPQQLEAWKASQPRQPALFELKDDSRPAAERTAARRYMELTLLSILADAGG